MRRQAIAITGPDGEVYSAAPLAWLAADYRRRRIAETFIGSGKRRIRVSTVRLMSSEQLAELVSAEDLARIAPPIFETKVFGGTLDDTDWRYRTEGDARMGHQAVTVVARLTQQLKAREAAQRRRMHKSYRAAWA